MNLGKLVRDDIISLRDSKCLALPKIMQIEITNKCTLHCPQCLSIPWLQSHSIRYREPSIPNDRAT